MMRMISGIILAISLGIGCYFASRIFPKEEVIRASSVDRLKLEPRELNQMIAAAENGDSEAAISVFLHYRHHDEHERRPVEIYAWLILAAKNGRDLREDTRQLLRDDFGVVLAQQEREKGETKASKEETFTVGSAPVFEVE